ncbi:MAG: enhanced entry protein EnhB [Legionella sp.]
MQQLITFFITLVIIVFNTNSARATTFPHGCEVTGFGFNNSYLILNDSDTQKFYLLANRTDKKIELERLETSDLSINPQLQSKIDPFNWSAFASDINNFHFQCYTLENDSRYLVNCADVLEVCQYPRARFALSNMGNYWVSTNKPKDWVIKDAAAKGIYLKW